LTDVPATWLVGGRDHDITGGALVGVLNVTPDSFSDGGEFEEPRTAIEHGLEMIEQGALFVDIGGESTRPGARPVDEASELHRVMPVVEGLVAEGTLVSVDTSKPAVASTALREGAAVINDVTGFTDPGMIGAVADSGCGVVVVHMKGAPIDMHLAPCYEDVVAEVEQFLLDRVAELEEAGVDRRRMAIDPGIGFGKRAHHSLTLLSHLDRLAGHGLPVMIGTSRKGFLGKLMTGDSREALDRATAVTTALGFAAGARLFRVHDVAKSRDALEIAGAIVASQ